MENNSKNNELKFQFTTDLEDNQIIGEQLSGESSPNIESLNQRISESLKQAFHKLGNEWTHDFIKSVRDKRYLEAYSIFEENSDKFLFCQNLNVIDAVLEMDLSVLNFQQKKDFLTKSIALSHKLKQAKKTFPYIEILLSEYQSELSREIYFNLLLEKANNEFRNKNYNSAYNLYTSLLNQDVDIETKAWVFRGLSHLPILLKEFETYAKKSFNAFLLSGNKKEAISDLISLSHFFFSTDPEKCIFYIKESLNLLSVEYALDKERLGSLHFHLAKTYFQLKNYNEAQIEIEKSISLRKNLIGNEEALHSTYFLAYQIYNFLKNITKKEEYSEKAESIASQIKNPLFNLRIELANSIDASQEISQKLIAKVESANDIGLKTGMYLLIGSQKKIPYDERFSFLDKAINLIEKQNNHKEELALAYYILSSVYQESGDLKNAINYKIKGLELDPYHLDQIAQVYNYYKKENQWETLHKFLNSMKDLYENSQHFKYMRAFTLYKMNDFQKSIDILKTIQPTSDLKEPVDQLKLDCLNNGNLQLTSVGVNQITDFDLLDFRSLLHKCADSISTNSRMHFWKYNQQSKKHQWKSSPEETGKQLIMQYLNGKLDSLDVEILDEIKASAGRIDLYVKIGSSKFIVEIKLCGSGYSTAYVNEGEAQLFHYMESKNVFVGFLFVFDGRSRDQGKYFKFENNINNNIIYTIICDVNPKVK